MPFTVNFDTRQNEKEFLNLVHLFTNQSKVVEKSLLQYKSQIEQNGMIWVSWCKKSSKK